MHRRRRRASGDFVAASSSSSLPPVSEAANEFVEFFSPLAATTHSHCVKPAFDVDDALGRGRDAAVASRALLFTDDNEMQRFLNAERRQRLDEEERDQQTLIELHRDLVKASTSQRRRRIDRAVILDAAWLTAEEGQPSTSFAALVPQPHSSAHAHADPTQGRVPTRYCSSCRHDLPAATHFYSDRKTCKACLRYHLRHSRRKRKHEKMRDS
jgi:hypothetical protein